MGEVDLTRPIEAVHVSGAVVPTTRNERGHVLWSHGLVQHCVFYDPAGIEAERGDWTLRNVESDTEERDLVEVMARAAAAEMGWQWDGAHMVEHAWETPRSRDAWRRSIRAALKVARDQQVLL
ncbi:hypothetical protein [Sphingomonas sp.]|uniref:hypothetical protein n=1 Tax=Sphingomonas sp. TaxID=28214 RepID=UPI0035C833E6